MKRLSPAASEFEAGMDDDLNTSVALAVIHNLTRVVNTALARKKMQEENKIELVELLKRFDSVLNIFGDDQREMLDSEIQNLIDERQEARRRRDFARGDEIRDELAQPRHNSRRHQRWRALEKKVGTCE